jgi:hypothetical protein
MKRRGLFQAIVDDKLVTLPRSRRGGHTVQNGVLFHRAGESTKFRFCQGQAITILGRSSRLVRRSSRSS